VDIEHYRTLLQNEERRLLGITLREVRLALARIDAGTFGLCEHGGEHIDEKRLEAIPWTRYCSAHEAEAATGSGPRRVTL